MKSIGYILVVAEKPSVARDIAKVLAVRERADGFLSSDAYRVTWAIGHLVALSEPQQIDEKYKKWKMQDLPMLPAVIPLQVLPKTKKQYGIVKKLMNAKDCDEVICATDAGREGELIFRYLYQMAGCKKAIKRLWISSMTDDAIREGFAKMKPGEAYENLFQSARCRSEADWLVGMNASRAYSLRYDALLSIGRVQTPTLALIVRRQHEIAQFVKEEYFTVTADFGDYTGLYLHEETGEKRVHKEALAKEIAESANGKPAKVEAVVRETKRELPPFLYDLTSLQRDANRLLGYTAKKTLQVAQKLYEEHKLITYPRTDSRHLPKDMGPKTRSALQALAEPYQKFVQTALDGAAKMPRRVYDDAKVTDHHAIIPTSRKQNLSLLKEEEKALFDLIARRLLAAFHSEHIYDVVRVLTRAVGCAFESLGREVKQEGFQAILADMARKSGKKKTDDAEKSLPSLQQGDARTVEKATMKAEKTKPPPFHTDASLLSAMERAGRDLEDEELRESMKKSGLGTPATRAQIIERLIEVGYVKRSRKSMEATEKGINLIRAVPEDLALPETTGKWEKALSDIALGQMEPDRFIAGIRNLSAHLVQQAEKASLEIAFEKQTHEKYKGKGAIKKTESFGKCPLCKEGDVLENSKAFYCARWREGCKLTFWKDCLVKGGGPALSGVLVALLLEKKQVVGSTGTMVLQDASVGFVQNRRNKENKL